VEDRNATPRESLVFGAVLAGGASRRFGSAKALAEVAGISMLRRACTAIAAVSREAGVVTHLPEINSASPLPTRPDVVPGAGPLGGVLTAVRWAVERGFERVLCVGCDMPHLDVGVLRLVVEHALHNDAEVTAAAGLDALPEPLCAVYSAACAAPIERRIARRELALRDFLAATHLHVVPRAAIAAVRGAGDPFRNVNTRADLALAETEARDRTRSGR
jgi:molybdopterin-guanine dinucleotide biosynthesis protein A